MINVDSKRIKSTAKQKLTNTHHKFECPKCGYIAFHAIDCPICNVKLELKMR